MIKIKILKRKISEAAKWRGAGVSRELNKDELDRILADRDPNSLFVHFNNGVPSGDKNVPQVSFNPKTEYKSTPIGIYTYDLNNVKDEIAVARGGAGSIQSVPFAGNLEYVYILEAKNPNDIYNVVNAATDGTVEKTLKSMYDDFGKEIFIQKLIGAYEEIEQSKLDDELFSEAEEVSSVKPPLLKKIKKIADLMESSPSIPPAGSVKEILKKKESEVARLWLFAVYQYKDYKMAQVTNYLQNTLGIKILKDTGYGIIHYIEKEQTVIFSTSSIRVLYTGLNPFRSSRGKHLGFKEAEFNLGNFGSLPQAQKNKIIEKIKTTEYNDNNKDELKRFIREINKKSLTADLTKALFDKYFDSAELRSDSDLYSKVLITIAMDDPEQEFERLSHAAERMMSEPDNRQFKLSLEDYVVRRFKSIKKTDSDIYKRIKKFLGIK